MQKIFFYPAAAGWIAGFIIHVLTFADIDVADRFPFIWILHLMIFVVWIPAIIKIRKMQTHQPISNIPGRNLFSRINALTPATPQWMKILAFAGFYYAIFNFAWFIFHHNGSPSMQNGTYVLQNHGQLIREITEKEFHHFKALEIRGFSGHWIAFYGIATAILFPFDLKNAKS